VGYSTKADYPGDPPNRGNQITAPKPAKTHGRRTWLQTATHAARLSQAFSVYKELTGTRLSEFENNERVIETSFEIIIADFY